MKTRLILTCALAIFVALGSTAIFAQEPFEQPAFAISPSEVETNREAPKDYDAKFKQNDLAIVDSAIGLRAVRVVAKSGGIYKVTYEDAPESVSYYRTNAVYPYFDAEKYKYLVRDNEEVIAPFLDCYAKKHNLDSEKVGYFGWRHGEMTMEVIQEKLQLGMPKMAQLERDLKSQFPVRPNTFYKITENPAILDEIVSNRDEYAQCVIGRKESSKFDDSVWLMAHRNGIADVLKYVEEHDPTAGDELGTDSEYAFYAVSPRIRTAWLKEKKALDFEGEINKLLKPLADALAKKVPNYFPKTGKYSVHNAGEEALMKTALENPARYKIFKIGLAQSTWDIDRNALGIPNARYKNGLIYARDTAADYPYCVAVRVNVVQAYAGGGTYAASRPDFVNETLVGCPAGAK